MNYEEVKKSIDLLWNAALPPYFTHRSPWKKYDDPDQARWEDRDSGDNRQRKAGMAVYQDCLDRLLEKCRNDNTKEFIDLNCEKARLMCIRGILCEITGIPAEKNHYYASASGILEQAFEKADRLCAESAASDYPWAAKSVYAFAEFARNDFKKAAAVLLSVPDDNKPEGNYVTAMKMLSGILPFFPAELFFCSVPEGLHGIARYPVTEKARNYLRQAGFSPEKTKSRNAREIYSSGEAVFYSSFLILLTEAYISSVYEQPWPQYRNSVGCLRGAVAAYAHYVRAWDTLLKTDGDRLTAFYYQALRRKMTTEKYRDEITQFKLSLACTHIFEREIIVNLKQIL